VLLAAVGIIQSGVFPREETNLQPKKSSEHVALSCLGRDLLSKEFTDLLVYVLHVSHPSALKESTVYARQIVF
jgi:hypothetical protein